MKNIFYPDVYVKNVYELTADKLKQMGIKAVFFDIDNTLEPFDIEKPRQKVQDYIASLNDEGIKVCIFSNNRKKRIKTFCEGLKAIGIWKAGKPLTHKLNKIMEKFGVKKEETAIVGDQIFTDILCGNLAGIMSIMTDPICNRDQMITKIKRPIDRWITKRYLKREGIR